MNCLVTGGAGFIGSTLVDKLIEDNHNVVIFDDLSTGNEDNINSSAEFYSVDISNVALLDTGWFEKIMKEHEIDVIFHTAALARVQPSISNPSKYNTVNVTGTLNMLKSAVDAGVKRFVYSASSSAYGNQNHMPLVETMETNPLSPYGLQKLIGEQYCKLFSEVYDLETVSLRYFNVYGDRQNLSGAYCLVIGKFIQQKMNKEDMTIFGDGKQKRDFTYVGDVVNANILASTSDKVGSGEVINIGNGDNRSVNQIADMVGGHSVHLEAVKEPRVTLADNSKAKELLGWKPTMDLEIWMSSYKEKLGI
tara:strand:- start:3 stop:923 length:921 start_codon:yes stop_codon:yes gene_type:complete